MEQMRIRLSKEAGGYQLTCTRRSGSSTQSTMRPGLPDDDLAHYVVEKELHLDQGFFGLINEGYTIQQLSDAAVVPTLPPQALEADVVARTLQGLSNGTIAQHDFIATVEAELPRAPKRLTDEVITHMLQTYVTLLNSWEQVAEGAALELRWM